MNQSIESYYEKVSNDAFNNAEPRKFFQKFAKYHANNSVAVRLQESAVNRAEELNFKLDEQETINNAIVYAQTLLNDKPVDEDFINQQMNIFRKGSHKRIDDLPDWSGDTIYAFVPATTTLHILQSWFDEVDLVSQATINNTKFDIYRLWWD